MPEDDRTCQKLDKLDDSIKELSERLVRVETKLSNGKLDLKTWLIIAGLLFGGGAANYGLQSVVQGEPQVRVIQAPPLDYSMMRPNGR